MVDMLSRMLSIMRSDLCPEAKGIETYDSDPHLRLVAYEAGQHFVGVGGGENDKALTDLLLRVNAHPRMAGIYQKYYAGWEAANGDLLCHFSSVGAWSKWGSWGLLQHADDDPSRSPKFVATMTWARKLGQPVFVPSGGGGANPEPATTPKSDGNTPSK